VSHDRVSRTDRLCSGRRILLVFYEDLTITPTHPWSNMASLPPGKPQISEKGDVPRPGDSLSTNSPAKVPKSFMLPAQLQWIPRNWTWSKLKPVIRCSIVAWVSSVLFIIPRVEFLMGQVRFLVPLCVLYRPISQGEFFNPYR